MPSEIFNFRDERLRLYLAYDYLRLDQYANLLKSINGVYENLFYIFSPLPIDFQGVTLFSPPSLCIDSIETGDSIISRISFDKRFLFSINRAASDDGLELHLPKWSAVLAIAGIAITQLQSFYKNELEIEHLRLENKKIELEIQKEFDLEKLNDEKNPKVNSLNMFVNQFASEINEENIHTVEINGFTLKEPALKPFIIDSF